jgi:chromosome segregation ATPase
MTPPNPTPGPAQLERPKFNIWDEASLDNLRCDEEGRMRFSATDHIIQCQEEIAAKEAEVQALKADLKLWQDTSVRLEETVNKMDEKIVNYQDQMLYQTRELATLKSQQAVIIDVLEKGIGSLKKFQPYQLANTQEMEDLLHALRTGMGKEKL